MSKNKKKSSAAIVRFFQSKAFFITIVAVIFLALYGYGRSLYQDYVLKQEIQSLQDEIRSLETKRFESLELLEYVMSDAFIEREARQSLNLRRVGEEIYIASEDTHALDDQSMDTEGETRPYLRNPIKWWYYFIHKEYHSNS